MLTDFFIYEIIAHNNVIYSLFFKHVSTYDTQTLIYEPSKGMLRQVSPKTKYFITKVLPIGSCYPCSHTCLYPSPL